MNNMLIDPVSDLPEDSEARREHERYQCENLTASFTQLNASSVKSHVTHEARITDISLKGLSIKTGHIVNTGDILSIELNPSNDKEVLTAVIMWRREEDNQHYTAGLQLISEQNLRPESAIDTSESQALSEQNQITCPSCHETSFFLREINSDQKTPDIYHCCRCNHSHPITEVMAFNRRQCH